VTAAVRVIAEAPGRAAESAIVAAQAVKVDSGTAAVWATVAERANPVAAGAREQRTVEVVPVASVAVREVAEAPFKVSVAVVAPRAAPARVAAPAGEVGEVEAAGVAVVVEEVEVVVVEDGADKMKIWKDGMMEQWKTGTVEHHSSIPFPQFTPFHYSKYSIAYTEFDGRKRWTL
jgi:hypothetical protein